MILHTLETPIDDPETSKLVTAHFGTDHKEGGREAAQQMKEATGGQGPIAILNDPLALGSKHIVEGFREAFATENPPIEIIETVLTSGRRDAGYEATQKLLRTYRKLNGVFGVNDSCALGAYEAVRKERVDKEIAVLVFGGSEAGKRSTP